MIISKRFFGILLVAAFSATAWALATDADGYYLIGSVQDWKDFAALVETTPTANAKMTADINLGDVLNLDETVKYDKILSFPALNSDLVIPFIEKVLKLLSDKGRAVVFLGQGFLFAPSRTERRKGASP